MHILGETIDRRPALSADGLCEAALAVFVHDPDCRALAVVRGDRPVALLARDAFLARMEAPGAPGRPILEAAESDPLIVEASEEVGRFVDAVGLHRPAALLAGFVVVEDGAYAGVCDLARLLPALGGARKPSIVIERINAEVRGPAADALAAIDGLRRLRLPAGAEAYLDTIDEAAHGVLALLGVAEALQKAEAERLEIKPEPRRLQALMDELEARWGAKAAAAGVTLLVAYDGAPDCAAMVDPCKLEQVFDALVGHAMAHAGSRGSIEASLQARSGDHGLVLCGRVRDNGPAYAPDYLAGLFRGGGDAAEVGGMGVQLGLMLAERSVAAMAGVIEARANPGAGATVAFEFPVEAAEAAEDDAPAAAPSAARSAHILVVDDNATNRTVVEALCEMFDCSTESVADGIEAVEAARSGRFDVILMDIKMPRMDGVAATREIRKLPGAAGRAPIIALTANADADEVAQYMAAGMRAVVEKPIKPERLMEALDAALAGADSAHAAAAA